MKQNAHDGRKMGRNLFGRVFGCLNCIFSQIKLAEGFEKFFSASLCSNSAVLLLHYIPPFCLVFNLIPFFANKLYRIQTIVYYCMLQTLATMLAH